MVKASPSTAFRSRALLLMVLALFLIVTSSRVARPSPAVHVSSPAESRHGVIEAEEIVMEESCEGTGEEGECLMRRTLAAHVDYIYTQKQKN